MSGRTTWRLRPGDGCPLCEGTLAHLDQVRRFDRNRQRGVLDRSSDPIDLTCSGPEAHRFLPRPGAEGVEHFLADWPPGDSPNRE